MKTEQWFEKAAAYFNGTMTAEEARLFEMETAASDELSQLMQLWKTTDAEAAVYQHHKEDAAAFIATHQKLKSDFINEQADEFSTGKDQDHTRKLRFSVWKWVAVAAAITGVIFMVKMLTPSSQNSVPVAKFKKNSDTARNTIATDSPIIARDGNKRKEESPGPAKHDHTQLATLYAQAFAPDQVPENPNGLLDDAFFYYESAQYKKAISAFDSAGSRALTRGSNAITPLTDFYAVYYKALSMMSVGEEAAAIPLLTRSVLLSPSEIMKVKAQWYLSLAYIKQDRISSAINSLQLLINNPLAGPYKHKAEKLLAALNK